MKFAWKIAAKNIQRKPFRSIAAAALVMLLALAVFAGAVLISGLKGGLASYQARLGADIIVVPSSATGHGTVDDIFLQGITGNYYMSGRDCEKVEATEGIAAVTRQFFLTSAKASCCSSRVQIIGFDPATDFSILPWIEEEYAEEVGDGDIIVGNNINVPENQQITFYGVSYRVAGKLGRTGTGLDSAVYANMNTVREMAVNCAALFENGQLSGVDIGSSASAILIKVREGFSISDVTDDINIHITKVQASSARDMISGTSEGLSGVSRVIGILIAAVWVLAVIILIVVFTLLFNERKKEFAVLRVMGASGKLLSRIIALEALAVSAAGAVLGLVIGFLIAGPLSSALKNALSLPLLTPGIGKTVLIAVCALAVSAAAGIAAAVFSGRKIAARETGLLLREDD